MDKTEYKKKILVTFGILFIFGVISIGANGMLELGFGQTNSTGNQNQTSIFNAIVNNTTSSSITTPVHTNSTGNQSSLSTPTANTTAAPETTTPTPAQEKASSSIKGAISETGEFLGNVSQKVTTSKTAGALLNDTSNILGKAYVESQKFFNPN
jgi:cytoskeletal protein RodZ